MRHESLKNKVKFHLELFMTHLQIVTLNGYRFLDDLNSTKYWGCDRQYFLQAIWFGVDLLLYHLQPVHASCSYRCICIQYKKHIYRSWSQERGFCQNPFRVSDIELVGISVTRQLVRRAKGQSKVSFKQYNLDPYYKVATVKFFFFFNFSFFSGGQFLYWIPPGLKSRVIKFIKKICISFVVVLYEGSV